MGLRHPPDGYCNPVPAQGARWKNFYRSAVKGNGNRYKAKCGFCLAGLQGRPEKLHEHVIGCPSWPIAEKNLYLAGVDNEKISGREKKKRQKVPKILQPLSSSGMPQITSDLVPRPTSPPSPQRADDRMFLFANPPSPHRANDKNNLLLKAIISGKLPFNLADNIYFKDFLHALRPSYNVPSSDTLREHLSNEMFSEHLQTSRIQFPSISDYTICFDGFTDMWENSIYAYMLLTEEADHVLEVTDLSTVPVHLLPLEAKDRLLSSLFKTRAVLDNAVACVTDSTTELVQVQSGLQLSHPNVIPVRCCLHAFNTLVKDILGFPSFAEVCKLNQKLVNYFTSSYYWRKVLNKWQEIKKTQDKLSSFCDTRWCSVARVCIGVATYQDGFIHCLELSDRPEYPSIKDDDIRNTIMNQHHFDYNMCLVEALKPIVDVIDRLERRSTTVADVLWSLIEIYQSCKVRSYRIPTLKAHILYAIGKLMNNYTDPIYFIALFLHPVRKNVAMSGMMTSDKIIREALQIGKAWHFSKSDTCLLLKELISYRNIEAPFNEIRVTINGSPHDFWSQFRSTSPLLYRFAMKIFAIVPHTGSCERVFSSLGLSKTKVPSCFEIEWLNKLAQLQCDVKNEAKQKKSAFGSALTMGGGISQGYSHFETSAENELCRDEAHGLIDESIEEVSFDTEIFETNSTNPMDQFFDLDAFQHEFNAGFDMNGDVGAEIVDQREEEWTIDDIISQAPLG